jgi:hypothetical protein
MKAILPGISFLGIWYVFHEERHEMSRINGFRVIIFQTMLSSGMFLLLACGQMTPASQQNEATTAPIETQQNSTQSTEGDADQMTPSLPTPVDAGLQNLLERIKTDLASRQAVAVEEITLLEMMAVEWSDSSLDCPQPGMDYLQVITPGYRIVLQVNDQSYEYHTNRDAYFVYCENQVPPILPKP